MEIAPLMGLADCTSTSSTRATRQGQRTRSTDAVAEVSSRVINRVAEAALRYGKPAPTAARSRQGVKVDMSIRIRRLDTASPDFAAALDALAEWDVAEDDAVTAAVRDIIADVRARGDAALVDYTRRFDRLPCRSVADLTVDPADLHSCLAGLPVADRRALEGAADRIRRYHAHQLQHGFETRDEWGNRLGMRVTALNRVGVYVPGGQASYPRRF
jgi:hypothetical protein